MIAALGLSLSGCAGTSARAICESVGGTYTGATCARSSPGQEAREQACEIRGGVYLAGQDTCAFGMGR